jgi:hypothetical protein
MLKFRAYNYPMNDALTTALRTAADQIKARGIHGRLSVRRMRNDGRTVGVVTVRLAPESTGQDERVAVATVYACAERAACPVTVLAA